MSYSRKKKQEGFRTYFFENPPGIFRFFTLLWKIKTKQGFIPTNSTKLCYTPQKFYCLKPRPLEIPHDFFLITPGNSTLFLINPWKIHLLFLQSPYKVHMLNTPVCFFSDIAQWLSWYQFFILMGRSAHILIGYIIFLSLFLYLDVVIRISMSTVSFFVQLYELV